MYFRCLKWEGAGVERGRSSFSKNVCRLLRPGTPNANVSPNWFSRYVAKSSVERCINNVEGHVLSVCVADARMSCQFVPYEC